jgi:hypothetical protein
VAWFKDVTWEQFALAESWVLTRVFHNPKTREPFLVPILDMANHSSTPTPAYRHTETGIELRRDNVDMDAGDELTVSYGFLLSQDTGKMLYRYGFIDRDQALHTKAMTMYWKTQQNTSYGEKGAFRIWSSIHKRFHDLPFLTLENW